MRIKITDISEEDAYFEDKEVLVGQTGNFQTDEAQNIEGWTSGQFFGDDRTIEERIDGGGLGGRCYFCAIKYEEL